MNLNYSPTRPTVKNSFNTIVQDKITQLLQDSFKKLALPTASLRLFSKYHIQAKFLRSNLLLNLLIASDDNYHNTHHDKVITYCVIIELLHIANKVHDMIEPNQKINSISSYNLTLSQAVLLGDLIFTIAFEQIIKIADQKILEQFSYSTKTMAYFEAKLSELRTSDLDTIISVVEQKHWPLYQNIIYLLEHTDEYRVKPCQPEIITVIKNINKINIVNKIINQQITFNQPLDNLLYSEKNYYLLDLTKNLSTLITNTNALIEKIFSGDAHKLVINNLKQLLTLATN